jgi:hypothetical protein
MGHSASHRRACARAHARARALALSLLTALLVAACGGEGSDVSAPAPAPAPAPVPAPAPAPVPSTEPTPPVMRRMARSLPGTDWDPDQPVMNSEFGPFDTDRHREVGQTIEITEAFVLHQIALLFIDPTVALPGFHDIYYDGIDWGRMLPYVDIPPPTDDLAVTLSIVLYRSVERDRLLSIERMTSGAQNTPNRVREVIPLETLEVVSDQLLVGPVRTDGRSFLDLTEPVVMEPGMWLVALRTEDTEGGADLIWLPIAGLESGGPLDVIIPPDLDCDFEQTPDPTPGHAFYVRSVLEGGLEAFAPGFGKVQGGCVQAGYYFSPGAPGDIGLDLWGFPLN